MKKFNYKVKDNVLTTLKPDGKSSQVSLPWPIVQIVKISDVLIIRVEPKPGISFNENVYCVDHDGKILWQVKKREYVYEDSPYTGMTTIDDHVKLLNWDGFELVVEPITGKELSAEYGK
jgi:hypothetical protein